MKNVRINISITVVAIMLLAGACKEEPPEIDYSIPVEGDTTYVEAVESPQPKKVMFEEFTGVKCTNCPESHALLKTIVDANPGKVVSVGVHATGLAIPYNDTKHTSKYDLRTESANTLFNNIGGQGLPQAAVDRFKFADEDEIAIFIASWEGKTDVRLAETPPVNMYIETYYQESTQKLYVSVTTKFTSKVDEAINIVCGITQDSIKDLQGSNDKNTYPPDGVIKDYYQRHVLRTYASGINGIPLSAPDQDPGRVVVKNFIIDFADKDWDINKCSVFAFAFISGANSEVLQAAEEHVK